MTKPRKELVSITDTPYYHIVSRCVRRTFLCGYDHQTKTDYEYRRQWIVDRIQLLSSLFSIDICSYAIMSNHYHLVVHINPEQTNLWSNKEVAQRWTVLYQGPLLIQQWLSGLSLNKTQKQTVDDIIKVWRERLSDLSWYIIELLSSFLLRRSKEQKSVALSDQWLGHLTHLSMRIHHSSLKTYSVTLV